jgi:hypothetical protein
MAKSRYGRRADVLLADLANQERAFSYHASSHGCQDADCKTKRHLRAARDSSRDDLARLGISRPQPTVTWLPPPPHLREKPA